MGRSRKIIRTAALWAAALAAAANSQVCAQAAQTADSLTLYFSLCQSREIYERSSYGEPPQFAIWLQEHENGRITTVFVTRRTARGEYAGKVECPVSLPLWIGAFRKETGRNDFPTPRDPFYDTVTGATPQKAEIRASARVEAGKSYDYYIEMNVAGDYNRTFPKANAQKRHDKHGNGQPSLLFHGTITAVPGDRSAPELSGRSHQYYYTAEPLTDLEGIDSAREVFTKITVECISGDKKP